MNTKINDGGPAFPITINGRLETDCATTLRDYFAAKALCGYLSGRSQYDTSTYENIAKESYLYADAMLKSREVKP